jgi:hypothetical protein
MMMPVSGAKQTVPGSQSRIGFIYRMVNNSTKAGEAFEQVEHSRTCFIERIF